MNNGIECWTCRQTPLLVDHSSLQIEYFNLWQFSLVFAKPSPQSNHAHNLGWIWYYSSNAIIWWTLRHDEKPPRWWRGLGLTVRCVTLCNTLPLQLRWRAGCSGARARSSAATPWAATASRTTSTAWRPPPRPGRGTGRPTQTCIRVSWLHWI